VPGAEFRTAAIASPAVGVAELDLSRMGRLARRRRARRAAAGVPLVAFAVGFVWTYVGIGRYDRVLNGGVAPGEVVVVHKQHLAPAAALAAFLRDWE
jgi:hypothetical protein